MKITIKAKLVNVSKETDTTLSHMMLIYCTAMRFSFKRLLESAITGELEKLVSAKYGLNIRQAKDAVEEARQTIASQKELVKLNYANYTKKAESAEKAFNRKNLSDAKRKRLDAKLDKRKKKQAYYKSLIDVDTIPPVVFGTKKLFHERCKGNISKQEWQDARNNRLLSRGDKTLSGNPNLRIIVNNDGVFLEVSTLERTQNNRAVKIQIPLYLPQKLSKKTGAVNGRDYRTMMFDYLKTGEAYQVELIKRDGEYYCHITIDESKIREYKTIHTGHTGLVGIDTNPDGLALTLISRDGNYLKSTYLRQHELKYARSDRRENLCGELAKQAVEYAKQHNCGVAVEDLRFSKDKDVSSKFARISHQFIYKKLLLAIIISCIRAGVELIQVKPQYTSKIGLYKYYHQYGIGVHNGAAMAIARRAYGLKEKIPKPLRDKLIKDADGFNTKTEWGKWAAIDKAIKKALQNNKMKGGTGFWQRDRKTILRAV